MSDHEIVILGANFGGLGTAHYILKHTIPALKSLDFSRSYHVTVVGPSTSFYFKIAMPRVIADPSRIDLDQAIVSHSEYFSNYSASDYSFVQGLATAVDGFSKTITVQLSNGSTDTLRYDSLIISTGATSSSPLWTVKDDLSSTRAEISRLHSSIPKAETVLIAGGGPVGVELAGEIATKYPKARITLLSGTDRVLPRLSIGTSGRAESSLKGFGVTVNHKLRTVSAVRNDDGTTTVNLTDGNYKIVDVYIDATGGKPNTGFLPAKWLDSTGRVKTDLESLRVTGVKGVYALGDASSASLGGAIDTGASYAPVSNSLGMDIARELKGGTGKAKGLQEKKFKQMKGTQLVPIGKNGVGQSE